MLQGASTVVGISFVDSKQSRVEHDEREVLACCHCRLVQFRTRTSLFRRCHKPLDGEVWNRTELDAAGVRSELVTNEVSDAVKNLGVRVLEIRKERGLMQRVLASRMNVPRTYISKVETGRVLPSLSTLWRIAAGFEVSVTYLLCDESERRRDDEIARILADPFLAEIAQVVDKQNAVHRALILRAVRNAGDYPSEFVSGDLEGLVTLLDPGVVVRADQFAVPTGVPREIRGARIAAQQAITFSRGATAARLALIDGVPGLIVVPRGKLSRILRFSFADDAIAQVEVLADPAALAEMQIAILNESQIPEGQQAMPKTSA